MRNLFASLMLGAVLLGAPACGPSNKEIAGAKTAVYHADGVKLFEEVKAVVEDKYKIARADETQLGLQTEGKWYTPDGLVAEHQEDPRKLPDRSLNVVIVVTLAPVGSDFAVKTELKMMRFFQGRPNPDMLDAKDPSVPGWATSRADELSYDIYNAIKKYAVQPGGAQMVPAGSAAPASTPPPPATPPADGSAAGSAT